MLSDGTELSEQELSKIERRSLPPGVHKPVFQQILVLNEEPSSNELVGRSKFALGVSLEEGSVEGVRVRLRHRELSAIEILPAGHPTAGQRFDLGGFAGRVQEVGENVRLQFESGAEQLLGAYRSPSENVYAFVPLEGAAVLSNGETLALQTSGRESLALAVAPVVSTRKYEAHLRIQP